MDILEAARRGWNKNSSITMFLRNLTPKEFREHLWLDDYLADRPVPEVYCMKTKESIGIYHGHEELGGGVSLDTSPTFKECNGYREFVFKMAEHLGAERKDVFSMQPGIWDCIGGNLWNGAETVGHKEIADLADFFHKEHVRKYHRGARTRIFVEYEKLTPKEILRMKYNPRKVGVFKIEQTY